MTNARIKDLDAALKDGMKRNGNHLITVSDGPEFPDIERCNDCDLKLCCLARHQAPSLETGKDEQRPCLQQGATIRFYYHDTLCLSFNIMNKLVTDHGMWGYSVTTSRSIRWYLDALYYKGYIDAQVTVNNLCRAFKKRSGEEVKRWLPTT